MKHLLTLLIPILITGCQHQPIVSEKTTSTLVDKKQLQKESIKTQNFTLFGLTPIKRHSETLRIYIEGDGRAWMRRGLPSMDPTPRNRLVHQLMLNDAYTDIAYLGRPCQFFLTSDCNRHFWTFGRYDKIIIENMNSAISSLKQTHNYKNIELIGYSGGATIALLLTTTRDDITSIRTVAGNLEPKFLNKLHKVSPMPSAMSPIQFSDTLEKIPQIHFYGTRDSVVPKAVSEHYINAFKDKRCLKSKGVTNATHMDGWNENWKKLLEEKPSCSERKALR